MDILIMLTNKCDLIEDKNNKIIKLDLDDLIDNYLKIEKTFDKPIEENFS